MAQTKNKYFIFIFFLILIVIIASVLYCIKANQPLYKYSKQAIQILNNYKNNDITRNEAKEKINILHDKIESDNLNQLSIILSNISWNLTKGELSDTQIDEYIKKLK